MEKKLHTPEKWFTNSVATLAAFAFESDNIEGQRLLLDFFKAKDFDYQTVMNLLEAFSEKTDLFYSFGLNQIVNETTASGPRWNKCMEPKFFYVRCVKTLINQTDEVIDALNIERLKAAFFLMPIMKENQPLVFDHNDALFVGKNNGKNFYALTGKFKCKDIEDSHYIGKVLGYFEGQEETVLMAKMSWTVTFSSFGKNSYSFFAFENRQEAEEHYDSLSLTRDFYYFELPEKQVTFL
ncbi:hypothetical protein [Actinomyces vulturis]|uniref:hypothetical protein n=1 Tax=Actinomyces vulturis TaxID=1857645 RepID=UPI000835B281|nr:hypothetical protein [Actinomyces vulturis]